MPTRMDDRLTVDKKRTVAEQFAHLRELAIENEVAVENGGYARSLSLSVDGTEYDTAILGLDLDGNVEITLPRGVRSVYATLEESPSAVVIRVEGFTENHDVRTADAELKTAPGWSLMCLISESLIDAEKMMNDLEAEFEEPDDRPDEYDIWRDSREGRFTS